MTVQFVASLANHFEKFIVNWDLLYLPELLAFLLFARNVIFILVIKSLTYILN